VVPDRSRFHVPPELDEVHAKNERMVPGHILTGPVAVEGARPGDVLEVEILDVSLRQDWGYNLSARSPAPCPTISTKPA
jgi:acetamidase/formamidase